MNVARVHKAAINFLDTNMSGLVVTGSADKTIKVLDIFNNFGMVREMNATDAVFCGNILENLCLVGCGDGNILCYDLDSGDCLYGYGVDQAGAVHCMAINEDRDCLVTGGDSG